MLNCGIPQSMGEKAHPKDLSRTSGGSWLTRQSVYLGMGASEQWRWEDEKRE